MELMQDANWPETAYCPIIVPPLKKKNNAVNARCEGGASLPQKARQP